MKKIITIMAIGMVILCLGIVLPARAVDNTYGATGASKLADEELSISNMLVFAMQDEYLARGEYQKVIEKFGDRNPFY